MPILLDRRRTVINSLSTVLGCCLSLAVLISAPAYAQSGGGNSVEGGAARDVFTDQEREEVRAMLEQIVSVANNRQAQPTTAPQEAKDVSSINMAQVADRALDLTTDFVTTVAGKMEEVAPRVWEIMIRQQYARSIGGVVVPWGIFFFTFVLALIARRAWKLEGDEKDGEIFGGDVMPLTHRGVRGLFTFFVPFCIMLVTGYMGIVALRDSIMLLVNPQYYAVRDLLTMLLGNAPM